MLLQPTLLLLADQKHRIEDAHDLLLEALKSKNTCMHSVKLCKDLCTGLVNMRAFLESLKAAKCDLRHDSYLTSLVCCTPNPSPTLSALGWLNVSSASTGVLASLLRKSRLWLRLVAFCGPLASILCYTLTVIAVDTAAPSSQLSNITGMASSSLSPLCFLPKIHAEFIPIDAQVDCKPILS